MPIGHRDHEMDRTGIVELVQADSADLWVAARVLVQEYAGQLGVDLGFQDFQHEIDSLPREYGPPDGCFVLARQGAAFTGCGAVRRFDRSACEMKRLYVGYETMLLDTLPMMQPAQRLYAALGFEPT